MSATVPAASVVRLVSGVDPPSTAPIVVVAGELRTRSKAPLMVLATLMPAPDVSVVSSPSVMAAETVSAPEVAPPMTSVPAVMVLISACVTPRVSGDPLSTSLPPTSMRVPEVRVAMVVVPEPEFTEPELKSTLSALMVMLALEPELMLPELDKITPTLLEAVVAPPLPVTETLPPPEVMTPEVTFTP